MFFQKMIVWDKAKKLTIDTYRLVKFLPKEELYSLSDQMRRAAISIISNIAEGSGRVTARETRYFLGIARGSVNELHAQLIVCQELEYLTLEQVKPLMALSDEVRRMLTSLIAKESYD